MTLEQWTDFRIFFSKNHVELDKKFPSKSLVNGQPFITQPATVSNAEYAEYNKILDDWQEENNAL